MISVACVWVKGHVPYGVEYVQRLHGMVARHLHVPYRFVCLTDQPWALADPIETIPVASPAPLFGWWAKVGLFAPRRFDGRVLYFDLDTLIVRDLEPIVNFPSHFALIPTAGHFKPKDGHQVVPRFNSSVMVWDAWFPERLSLNWTPAVAERLWGDQDWIGEHLPSADTMPLTWFPRLSAIEEGPVPSDALVVLAKKPKPHVAAHQWSWVRDTWRAA